MNDIRRFLLKRPRIDNDNTPPTPGTSSSTPPYPEIRGRATLDSSSCNTTHPLDIGLYLHGNNQIDDDLRFKLLRRPWKPSKTYNFNNDVNSGAKIFLYKWLTAYTWLSYSAKAKGPFCRICVLFGPSESSDQPGSQKLFVNSPGLKYLRFHVQAKSHVESQWHIDAEVSSNLFKEAMDKKARELDNKAVEENRMKLRTIVSAILFSGKHNLPLPGKDQGSFFTDLLRFRADAGDESGADNSAYKIQNKLVKTCSDVLKSKIIEEVNRASVFSVLVDETVDIDGKEQLSIGVRYLRCIEADKNLIICEEFLGYVPIENMEAASISETIIRFLRNCKFDLNKLVGQGYDGCATMAGHIDDVKSIINEEHPPALLFHCASKVLNLVFNYLNDVSDVRVTAATTKDIIDFLKENTQHIRELRNEISNIPFHKTDTYESNRIFSDNFYNILQSLKEVSRNAPNPKTKTKAYQLYNLATTPTYIVTMLVIARYSAKLESTCAQLQEKYLNVNAIFDHIHELTNLLEIQRDNFNEFESDYENALYLFDLLNVEFTRPQVGERIYETNKFENVKEFFRITIFVPYLDSIIAFLRNRFSSTHKTAFSLMQLHPENMRKIDKSSFKMIAEDIQRFYEGHLRNFIADATNWYEWWMNEADASVNESIALSDLIGIANEFYPEVRKAIEIALILPATTCYDRTISTLRHVTMWNRSTEGHARLNDLCMLNVHRKKVEDDDQFIDKVINLYEQRQGFNFISRH